jgi:hypothetical protein
LVFIETGAWRIIDTALVIVTGVSLIESMLSTEFKYAVILRLAIGTLT